VEDGGFGAQIAWRDVYEPGKAIGACTDGGGCTLRFIQSGEDFVIAALTARDKVCPAADILILANGAPSCQGRRLTLTAKATEKAQGVAIWRDPENGSLRIAALKNDRGDHAWTR
jgi:hypothetical protein